MYSLYLNYVFILSAAIPAVSILTYSAIIFFYGSLTKTQIIQNIETDYPEITILIPSYNEEKVIEKRIQNILNYDYPQDKMRVIFIDDSNDATPDIIKKYVEKNSHLELLRMNERMGYSKAVYAGLKLVETDIVVLNEAGSFPLPLTLKNQISKFQNPEIGAVTGHSKILNTDERVGQVESLYLQLLNYLRKAESNMDTTIIIKGEATAYRTSLVKDIDAVEDTGSLDTSMAFSVRKNGQKTIYSPDVIFEEFAPSDETGFRKQKMIRAANIMRNLLMFKNMLLNPKYGKFGLISMPFYFISFFITPLLLPVALGSMLLGLLTNYVIYRYLTGLFITVLFFVSLFKRDLIKLILELEFSLLKAIYQIFFSKKSHDKIERVESTRR